MYKRDLITAEIEKIAQVLAQIMELKLKSKFAEAEALFQQTMEDSFGLSKALLSNTDISSFEDWLATSELSAEKLNSLSDFLYYDLGLSNDRNRLIAPKLNKIYNELSNKHKVVHLVNLHRQKTIQQYL